MGRDNLPGERASVRRQAETNGTMVWDTNCRKTSLNQSSRYNVSRQTISTLTCVWGQLIASHPRFVAPSNPEIRLWRYMDLSKFIALLQDRALYFARADKLGDPFEGSSPKKNQEILQEAMVRDRGSKAAWGPSMPGGQD
jgi:hypothetical protein